MQAPAGSRGALDYDTDTLDANIDFAQRLLQNESSPDANFLPNRTEAMDVFVYFADINLRDQIRKGETVPLQFAYEAADCRIYYTPDTVYNYTNLWQYAADAIWKTSSLCVKGSTGFSSTGSNSTSFAAPPSTIPANTANLTTYLNSLTSSTIANTILQQLDSGLPAVSDSASRNSPASTKVKKCTKDTDCRGGQVCVAAASCVGRAKVKQCLNVCPALGRACTGSKTRCSAAKKADVTVGRQNLLTLFCPPKGSTTSCSAKPVVKQINPNSCADCTK
jgi:hypothetical protein